MIAVNFGAKGPICGQRPASGIRNEKYQGLLTVEKSFRSGNTGNRVFIFSVMVITGNFFFEIMVMVFTGKYRSLPQKNFF